ncbi:MAG: cell envelope-related transcriptional attenuator [Parcubacteria group bacterium LiPW_39]|nr:MAG: cell envelope-related transcriptional attenuator [Parcubacteria group bacterium LiPW_39]
MPIFEFMVEENQNKQENRELEEFIREPRPRPKWRRFVFSTWIGVLILVLLGVGGLLIYKTGFTFSQMSVGNGVLPLSENTPLPDPDRLNILVLGLRGEGDPDGGLLTDSIMVASLKKSTGQVALISIPRDLYITMPGQNYKEKINFAYALGYEKKGAAGGLFLSKIAVSRVTDFHINYTFAVDHNAFKEIVDIFGGIDVYLDKPFSEKTQFEKEILLELPAGKNHLDGRTALYFVRSRYSTSDFDRARRQQLVLVAIKEKAFSLGILANPVKIYQLLEALGRNVRTDMGLGEIKELLDLAPGVRSKDIIHKVFDTTQEGLLYESQTVNGTYILLPAGDNFGKIQEACRKIFQ